MAQLVAQRNEHLETLLDKEAFISHVFSCFTVLPSRNKYCREKTKLFLLSHDVASHTYRNVSSALTLF